MLDSTPPTDPRHPGADPSAGGVRFRAYQARDRAAVRRICADTGFLGQPIDPNIAVAVKALWRCYARPYWTSSRAFLRWVLLKSWREIPVAPRNTPHFHMNILPNARSVRNTRALVHSLLDFLRAHGHRRVYGQMVAYASRRNEGLFKRYGFEVIDRVQVTKYRALHPEPVSFATVVKDLRPAALGGGREGR